jgi:Protein of unknown function (DUF3593)
MSLLMSIHLVASCLRAAKTRYGTTLANVDFLHGPAESLLTITNLLIGEPLGKLSIAMLVRPSLLSADRGFAHSS